jgi:hypothetical protein
MITPQGFCYQSWDVIELGRVGPDSLQQHGQFDFYKGYIWRHNNEKCCVYIGREREKGLRHEPAKDRHRHSGLVGWLLNAFDAASLSKAQERLAL